MGSNSQARTEKADRNFHWHFHPKDRTKSTVGHHSKALAKRRAKNKVARKSRRK